MDNTGKASRRAHHVLYRTTCLTTGRYYIGLHSTDNIDDRYIGSGKFLKYSIGKYGRKGHRRDVIELCHDRDTLCHREKEEVALHLDDPMCMNLCEGGGYDEATIAAISKGKKRYVFTEEHKVNLSKAQKNVTRPPCSEETKRKIGEKRRGKKCH